MGKMRSRFAPSPTGPLHLGHAYSALLAADMAGDAGGQFLLRIEDIDQTRARAQWENQIYADLEWLGLDWPQPVMRQSDRMPAYQAQLDDLLDAGLIYPCYCTRRDIQAALSAPQEGTPPIGPDGPVYPGTCRNAPAQTGDAALRLHMGRALDRIGNDEFQFTETGAGPNGETGDITFSADDALTQIGDIVLARRDMGTSYHLSVVVDDAAQEITHVTRGADLFDATRIHVILQALLGLSKPVYHHHRLIRDAAGKRLAKRDDARAIAKYRDDGLTPQDIRQRLGFRSASSSWRKNANP